MFSPEENSPKPEMPARMRLFPKVIDLKEQYLKLLQQSLGQECPALNETTIYFKSTRKPLDIPVFGIVKASLGVISVPERSENLVNIQIEGVTQDHDDSHPIDIMVVSDPELPPTLFESHKLDNAIDEIFEEKGADYYPDWGELLERIEPKHQMNDDESEHFLNFLHNQEPDPSLALREGEF